MIHPAAPFTPRLGEPQNDPDFQGEHPDLNDQQVAAVTHRGTPLLIVAGAGTGKTRTLVARVSSLLEDGVDPGRILLLTFTRRAAGEMVQRVMAATDRDADRIWAGTFHAVANRILRMYGSAAGLADGFTVLDHADAVDLLAMIRLEAGFGERGRRFPRPETIASIYSRMVNAQARLSKVLEVDYPWCAPHLDDLRLIFSGYTERKRQTQVLDYDDLLLFWRALTLSPVGEALRCMFDHVLIDEYQDTNAIQADIVSRMTGRGVELCAVGDDAQAIYGFRAATVDNMYEFPQRFAGTTVLTLEQNYRSTAPILQVANGLLAQHRPASSEASRSELSPEGNPSGFSKELWSTRSTGPMPSLITCSDEGQQSSFVAARILEARERGVDLREQAVLFRAGHHADGLELELTRRDIPYIKFGGLKYLEAAHVKDLLAMLRVVENPDDQMAWQRVLRSIDGVGPATMRRLLDELRVQKQGSDALARFLDGIGTFPVASGHQVDVLRSAMADCVVGDRTTAEQIDRLRGFCQLVFPNRYDNSAARLDDLGQLAVTARSYPSRSRFLTELTLDPPERTGDRAGKPHLDDDWLTLSTIHSAKGSEWRNVYLIHAADGNIPSDMALSEPSGLDEELRLAYVAATRAKDELLVSFPLRYHINRFGRDDRHNLAQLSRFFSPIQDLFEQTLDVEGHTELEAENLTTIGVADDVDLLLNELWQ